MKLIWLSHFIPYPPRGGAHQRSFNLLREAARRFETTLVAINHEGHPPDRLAAYASDLGRFCKHVLVWELPFAWRGAGWWARLALNVFGQYPFGCRARWSSELAARWKEVLDGHADSLVHFDSIDLAPYFPPAASFHKVLNHHNCESAMARRRAQLEPQVFKRKFLEIEATKIERLEKKFCPLFDVNLAVSDVDAKALGSHDPRARFCVVENGTDTHFFVPSEAAPEPDSIIFSGSLGWYPNQSAIRFFDENIWPLIKQRRPQARFYVAGQTPPQSLVNWAQHDPRVTLVADPEDMRPWAARAAVFVCPIVDGGGTRLKILDALAMGKAVVSTSIGVEGLNVRNGEHLLVADAPQDFANQVLRLFDDPALRQTLAANGRAMVEECYSWDAVGRHLEEAYRIALEAAKGKA
jgi:glycosyltransferase involved in cell wall biosynthesis